MLIGELNNIIKPMDFNENFKKKYDKLNKEQKKAVDTINNPLLVIAGPGSGKTEILSLRVGNILNKTDILASNILCLTYTEAAAVNMRNRLAKLIGPEGYRVAIHTFHSFCTEIIQKYPEYFYSGAYFSAADPLTQIQILQEIFERLPHKNSLSSQHPEQGYVYLKDSLSLIENVKKAGLTPENFRAILKHNQKLIPEINKIIKEIFGEKLSKETIAKSFIGLEKLKKLAEKNTADFPVLFFQNLAEATYESLKKATEEADEVEKNSILGAWRDKKLKKDENNIYVLKDTLYIDKLFAFADIYTEYKTTMYKKGYYDFNDMILDCIETIKANPQLGYEIQEQYQYVLVDEFQDTNKAQMNIIHLITNAEVNEGRANVMVVGDYDQAIYKFQGAEAENFNLFRKTFKEVEEVSMVHNYRSTQDILDIAMEIISKGDESIKKISSDIDKKLISSNPDIKAGTIKHKEFISDLYEYHFIAKEIRKRIDLGENPEEIAIIARKHKQLEAIVHYLKNYKIDVKYEREQNVFLEPHIAQIIAISKFLISISNKYMDEADEYLPKILSFSFWNINREDVWKISLAARHGDEPKNWLEIMKKSENQRIKDIASFLIELGVRSESEPLEKILDAIVGSHLALSAENEDDDELESLPKVDGHFVSPFKHFYFSRENLEHKKAEYLSFLSSLRVFVSALREYKSGEILSIKDLVEFVELHEKNEIPLNDKSPFSKLRGAVNLLTAHGAKGLEFETVFVLSCQDDIWAGRGISSKIVTPTNLPIGPSGDNEDDKLRLFYVAITRAKRHLYLTSYQTKEDGKEAKKLRFLVSERSSENEEKGALKTLYFPEEASKDEDAPESHEVLEASGLGYIDVKKISNDENKILQTLVEDYKMPVTHLNNFLNIERGGPQYFLEQNLLRFPQSKNLSGSYGTAIHATLEKYILYLKKENEKADIPTALDWFVVFLKKERMAPHDFMQCKERGLEALEKFLKEKSDEFNQKDVVEFNFREQGVVVDGAELNGKIDRIVDVGNNELEVHDYKTGKPLDGWEETDAYKKIKAYEYERQLIFYKILVENSREFGNKKEVSRGVLDFIEPKTSDGKIVTLDLLITEGKTQKLKKLISIVYKKIKNLDFPDMSKYSPDIKGIKEFEEDLLENRV